MKEFESPKLSHAIGIRSHTKLFLMGHVSKCSGKFNAYRDFFLNAIGFVLSSSTLLVLSQEHPEREAIFHKESILKHVKSF